MIQSMTGYGKSQTSSSLRKFTVEIKSLNSKQFDLSTRIPVIFREKEIDIRNYLAKVMERGKTDLTITFENSEAEINSTINIPVLKAYKKQFEEMADALGIDRPSDWYTTLMRMPEALHNEPIAVGDADFECLWECIKEAYDKLREFRIQEGKKLYDFFKLKINNINSLLNDIEPLEKERIPRIQQRLEEQLSKLTSIEYEQGRLEQEMIFYIEKLDVNEEKLRLRSHLNYFIETLGNETEIPMEGQGKKLGFIAQEMGREINTLGSKSNHAGMQKIVVKMKDELEQIKEQILNVL